MHYDDGPSSVYYLLSPVLSVMLMLIVSGDDLNIHVLLRARMLIQMQTVLIFSFLLLVFQSLILVPHVPNFVVLSSYVLYLLEVLQQEEIVALVYSHN